MFQTSGTCKQLLQGLFLISNTMCLTEGQTVLEHVH